LACVLISFHWISSLAAQHTPALELDPVVVTAAAFPAQEGEISANITIITSEEIERQQAVTVSEILTQVPGLHVDESGARGGLSSVYIRGGDPNFTSIMIDGIPINDPTNARGGSVDLSSLTPEHIERIEIVRGPASSLYGSDPMAGVINIVTRRGDKESRYGFTLEGGSFAHARGVLYASGSAEPVNYSLSLAYRRNHEQVDRDKFRLGNVGLNLDLLKSHNFSLRLTSQYSATSARAFPEGSGGPRFAILRDTERRDAQDFLTGLHFAHEINRQWQQDLSAAIFYRTQAVDSPGVQSARDIFAIPPANFDTTYTRYHFLWKSNYRVTSDWALAGGVQLTGERGEREGFQDLRVLGAPENMENDFAITRFTPAAFMETNVLATESLKATAGVRLDFPERFDSENEFFERLVVRMNLSAIGKKFDLQIPTARRSTEAYVKADLALTFSPNRSWSIFGVLANLTNAKYEDYVGFRAPGTNVRFGMSYSH
jgi:vitamin B12 transporter